MITFKVPFKKAWFFIEKDVDFLFNIGALEYASEEVLKCDLFEIGNQKPYEINIAILYAAYLIACERKGKNKKYTFNHAVYWVEHMSRESQEVFIKAVQDLLGKMSKGTEEKKK